METDFQWFETAINWWKLSVLNKKQSFRLDAFSWGRGPNPREATPLLMTHPLEKRDKSTRVLPKVESHSVIPNFLVVSSSGRHSKICHNLFNRYNLYIYTHIILRTAAEPKACAFRRAARLPWGRSSGIRPNLIPDQTGTQHESWAGLLWGLTQTSPQRLWCSSKKFRKKKGSKERSTDGCHQHWSSCFDHRHMLKLCEWPAGKAPSWLCQIKHQLASVFPTFWQYPQLYPQFYGGRH